MRLYQKNLEDLSSRISAAEAMKNSWQSPSDMAEVGEMLEQLQVQPGTFHLQPPNVTVEFHVHEITSLNHSTETFYCD
jgi:hypothetical protein